MHQLQVEDLEGRHDVSTLDELDALTRRARDGGNHLMIAGAAPYPMLDVLVRGTHAALHFFPAEGESCHQAVGTLSAPPESVAFPDEVTLAGSVLVDAETAWRCVAEFAETLERPTAVSWLQL